MDAQPDPRPLRRRALTSVGAALLLLLATYSVLFAEWQIVFVYAGKEQLFETVGAYFFLIASALCFAAFAVTRRASDPVAARRRFGYLLLALFFFVACGEELSWGQWVWDFDAPTQMEEINQQGELNLHNLWFLDSHTESGPKTGWAALITSNRLFDYFMIGFFAVAPFAVRRLRWVRELAARLGVPVTAAWLVVPLLLNWVLTAAAETWVVDGRLRHLAVSETREHNYAFLCLLGVWYLLARERYDAKSAAR